MSVPESACIAAISSARIANATALCDELCLRRFASFDTSRRKGFVDINCRRIGIDFRFTLPLNKTRTTAVEALASATAFSFAL